MTKAGHDITTLFLCGGLSKNPLFVQLHANTTGRLWDAVVSDSGLGSAPGAQDPLPSVVVPGLPVVLPRQTEAVLVGAAILGACASQEYTTIQV